MQRNPHAGSVRYFRTGGAAKVAEKYFRLEAFEGEGIREVDF
jgi:hypothetical protein